MLPDEWQRAEPPPEARPPPPQWVFDDGGRAEAGFQGRAGDCFTRAVAIASQRPYREIYDFVNKVAKDMKQARRSSHLPRKGSARRVRGSLGNAREGVRQPLFHEVMRRLGWAWHPTMRFGQGCKVHLCAEELPPGRLVVRVTKHMVAVVDGVVRDTYDPSRCGSRCVYGYFREKLGPRRCSSAGRALPAQPEPKVLGPPASPRLPPARPWVETPLAAAEKAQRLEAASPPAPFAPTPPREGAVAPAWKAARAQAAPAALVEAAPPPSPWAPTPPRGGAPAWRTARSQAAPAALVEASPRGGAAVARRPLAEEELAPFVEAVRGFSDDDSDFEVRRRCQRRRARIVSRKG